MSGIEPAELVALHAVADEIRDSLEEDGHTVETALDQNDCFTESNLPRSALTRRIVIRAARRGASQAGLGIDSLSDSLDLVWQGDKACRKYRLKRARVTKDGEYEFVVGDGSSLLQAEPDALWTTERWILGYTVVSGLVDAIFVAEVKGATDDQVRRLVLGRIVDLSRDQSTDGGPGFVSDADDTLPGFDDEQGDEGTEGNPEVA